MMPVSLTELRREYTLSGIQDGQLDPDPLAQFKTWLHDAIEAEAVEPNAFTLATASSEGWPSARIVLLKDADASGFVFYTNYESQKARELESNPRCSMVFYWGQLERQIRVGGEASRVSREEAQEYFRTRPRGSQLAAWASRQSRVIHSRKALENQLRSFEMEHDEDDRIPMPKWWGGYRVRPVRYEFWQGRPNRLHDRFRYLPTEAGGRDDAGAGWKVERLSP